MNIELSLLAVMLKTGDFGPIIRNEITETHFETSEGKILFNFITTYRTSTEGAADYPSLTIARARYANTSIELAEPDEGDTVANLTVEVRQAKLRSDLRQLAQEADDIANSAEDPLKNTAALLDKLRKLTEREQRNHHISLATGFNEVVENYINGEILPDGIPWPWPTLTDATKGLHKKEFIVIAGRPKSRKTFTALRVVVDALRTKNERVLIFSPEMPPRQVFLRCIAHLCNLPYREFKDGSMAQADEARLFAMAETYGRVNGADDDAYEYHLVDKIPNLGNTYPSLDIVQSTGRDTNWMASQIQLYKPTIILADSFYRQRPAGGRRNDSDWKAITALSREMKDMIMDVNVAAIGTHQLNRGAQAGVGDLGSLALADAIGADADGIYQVLSFKVEEEDVSALVNLGGREVPFNGLIFKNKPCYDYEEVGTIKNKQQVMDLIKEDDAQAAKEENERIRAKISEETGRPVTVQPATRGKGRQVQRAGKQEFQRKNKAIATSRLSDELARAEQAVLGDGQ